MENEYALAPIAFVVVALLKHIKGHRKLVEFCSSWIRKRVIRLCDLGRGFLAAQRDSIEEIEDFRKSGALTGRRRHARPPVCSYAMKDARSSSWPKTESSLKRTPRCWRGILTSVPEDCNPAGLPEFGSRVPPQTKVIRSTTHHLQFLYIGLLFMLEVYAESYLYLNC